MTKESRKRKVADFPEEFLTAWRLAAEGKLELSFPSQGKALNFRQQLHAFRKAWVLENGQASCAGWFKYDLVVEGARLPGEAEASTFILSCKESEWKKQLRASAEAMPPLPAPEIQNPSTLIPAGLGPTPAPSPEPTPTLAPEVNEALTRSLAKLGFTS